MTARILLATRSCMMYALNYAKNCIVIGIIIHSYMRISIRRFQTSSVVGIRGSANASSGISYFIDVEKCDIMLKIVLLL
jgi:hypothetical protein